MQISVEEYQDTKYIVSAIYNQSVLDIIGILPEIRCGKLKESLVLARE